MLTIDDTMWQELIAETRAAMDRLNSRCTGNYAHYSFECALEDGGDWEKIETRQHNDTFAGDLKAIGRIKATGELLKVSWKHKGKRIVATGRSVTAQSWIKAAAKSPAALLKATKLVDYTMFHIGEAYVSGRLTAGPDGLRRFDKDGNELLV